jgi:serine/threonine protein kinase
MSDQNPDSLPPETVRAGTVIGHYRVVRRLGVGGMGEVYLVQHTGTDEMFAMKVLLSQTISDASALDRFRREARTPARIESDHVVRVTHVDVSEELKGAPYLVMEYLRGEDLDQQLLQSGPMQPRDVVTYLQQVARVLDKAHAKGIVHRDLKPENIFITRREDGTPHVKILDFGIAKYTAGAGDMVSKTATSPGQIYGTPLYMAPEQAKGESKKISPQTDIWALGLIANRMLSAKDYWDAETLTALIAQVVYEPMQKPSERSSDFAFGAKYDAWFMQCCNRDIDSRFATAGEAVFKLGQALDVIDPDAAYAPGRPSSLMAAPPPSLRVAESRPLSKTELQLAQTGISGPPQEREGHAPQGGGRRRGRRAARRRRAVRDEEARRRARVSALGRRGHLVRDAPHARQGRRSHREHRGARHARDQLADRQRDRLERERRAHRVGERRADPVLDGRAEGRHGQAGAPQDERRPDGDGRAYRPAPAPSPRDPRSPQRSPLATGTV